MGNSISEIETYVSSMVMKFITGVESIDKYDEFVAQIKNSTLTRFWKLTSLLLKDITADSKRSNYS